MQAGRFNSQVPSGEPIQILWKPESVRPTVGGLLTCLAEGFALCDVMARKEFKLVIDRRSLNQLSRKLLRSVTDLFVGVELLETSALDVRSIIETSLGPRKSSAHDTAVISWINQTFGVPPRLEWSATAQEMSASIRQATCRTAVAVHLKNVPPYRLEDSNADGRIWGNALNRIQQDEEVSFVFIGKDRMVEGLNLDSYKHSIHLGSYPIAEQLAFVASSDCFLGMASGVAAAAMYSPTPLVLFKHPEHHVLAMHKEFGPELDVPLWHPDQWLIRRSPSSELIHQKWTEVTSTWNVK